MKNILITTEHKGVFFAQANESVDLTGKKILGLQNCKMAIYWGTTNGVMELCATGPTESSKISSPADIPVLHDITGVFNVTDLAAEKWLKA